MSPSSPTSNKRKRITPVVDFPTTRPRSSTPERQHTKAQIPITPPTSSPSSSSQLQKQSTEEPGVDMRITTNMNGVQLLVAEADTGSPRTKVAYHFQGLQLEDGGEVGKLSLDSTRPSLEKLVARSDTTTIGGALDESAVRKRLKVLGRGRSPTIRNVEIPETPLAKSASFGITFGPERTIDPIIEDRARQVTLQNEIDPAIFHSSPKPQSRSKASNLTRAYPSINRLSDSKSRIKLARKETYPLFGAADASIELAASNQHAEMTDQGQAQMTWRVDEITGHNPTDPDDDGEGINGIGFRPTKAEAEARGLRRKRQMEEYKSREAREARARRSERRGDGGRGSHEEREVERRVRFMEAEKEAVFIDL